MSEQSALTISSGLDGGATPPQEPRREQKHRTNQCEERFERDADEPERQRQKPDHGKENQCEQSQGPAKHEEDTPADKENQSFHIAIISSRGVPSTSRCDHVILARQPADPSYEAALQVGRRL